MATIVGPGDIHLLGKEWILAIGMELIGIQLSDAERNVDYWANDLDLTKDFLIGFLKSLDQIIIEFNKHQVSTQGHSFTEAYIRAENSGASFEAARHVLCARTAAQEEAIGRIKNAISDGYYIEASVLAECVVTNALQEILVLNHVARESSLYKILESLTRLSSNHDDTDKDLFRRADFWRRKRNNSVHGFVESRMRDLESTQREFIKRAEETAAEGIELCRDVLDWYQRKTVNMVPDYDQ